MSEDTITIGNVNRIKIRAIDRVEEVKDGQYKIYSIYGAVIATYWAKSSKLDLGETEINFSLVGGKRFERRLEQLMR